MKRTLFLFISICLLTGRLLSQEVNPRRALPLDSTLTITERITDQLLKYRFILIGEMHGTQEPVKFMTQVAKRLSMSKKVSIGFEISKEEIAIGTARMSAAQLRKSKAFTQNNDGRYSQA